MIALLAIRTALRFLTRIPLPGTHAESESEFAWSVAWYPFIGLIIGGALALTAQLTNLINLPPIMAAIIVWTVSVLLTGALHEDGLADSADAIGGGRDPQKRLEIMRDSRIGSFGGIALCLLFLWRVGALLHVETDYWPSVLVVSQSLSRLAPLALLRWLPYARANDNGVASPLIAGLGWHHVGLAWISMTPLLFLSPMRISILMLSVAAWGLIWGFYCKSKVNGITGDLAGAAIIGGECLILGVLCGS